MRASIGGRLSASGGRPSGFDYMRLLLAMGVIAMHSVIIAYGQEREHGLWASPWRPVIRSILPMFFALSGFLVAGSFERSRTMPMFFGLRIIRIYPALLVEVLLSAFILGVVFTTLPLGDYFGHPLFRQYLLNALGEPHYELPGVFGGNPYPGQVNRQLWTVPYELACYVALAGLSVLGGRKRPFLAPLMAVALTLAYIAARHVKYDGNPPFMLGPVSGPLLVVSFLVGVGLYSYRERIAMTHVLGLAATFAGMAIAGYVSGGEFVAPWFLAYATVYLGTANPPRIWLLLGADYSYGLFLYGYPIQQALVALYPGQSAALNTSLSIVVAGGFAAFSWHLVERPALWLRGPMTKLEARYLSRRARVDEADELAPRPLG